MQVAYIMKKAVFLRIVLTAAVLALLLSGCRFVRVEEEERKPVDYIVVERRDIPEELSRLTLASFSSDRNFINSRWIY